MSNTNEPVGVIYPIMQNNFKLLLERRNPAYVKFITHAKSKHPTRITENHFLLFYLSRKDKSIIGYAKIKNVSFKKPDDIKKYYINKIQMDKDEFNGYILDRSEKLLICLELTTIIKLRKPVLVNNPITMAGQYVSIDEITKLLGADIFG